jgi:hypothetical protein
MRRTLPLAVLATVALSLGCHTITEELPARPAPVNVGGIPVLIVPAGANPTPAPGSPVVVVTPNPGPTPAPGATPTPRPNPTPTPNAPSPGGGGGGVNDNTAPVARVGASVYFIERNGQVIPNSGRATTAQVGSDRVHLDCTPKDAAGVPTNPRGTPSWSWSDAGAIDIRAHPYNPTIIGRRPHTQCMSAAVDGVRSEQFCITFQ